MAFCVKCGTALPDGAMFCPKCGTDLRKWMQQAPAAQPEVPVQQPVAVCGPNCEMPAPAVRAEPGAAAVKAGRILSKIGFALSVFIFAVSYVLMALTVGMESILQYKELILNKLILNMATVAAQSLALSSFGLVFSCQGEKRGALGAKGGKRFGWIGFVLSLIALANVILILIAFAFSGRILSV